MKMKLYRAYFRHDDDWQILVVANNSREARKLAWPKMEDLSYSYRNNFTEMRVKMLTDIVIPPEIKIPTVYDICTAEWMCRAWMFYDDEQPCENCIRRVVRAVEEEEK